MSKRETKASSGLEVLATKYPDGIYLIGQDQVAMKAMVNLIEHQTIKPNLAIVTPPALIESEAKQKLRNSDIPNIQITSAKGGANIATAIFNSLIQLAWLAKQKS